VTNLLPAFLHPVSGLKGRKKTAQGKRSAALGWNEENVKALKGRKKIYDRHQRLV
jgi:hypothetical protein